jgi:hypothetical protein
MISATEKLRKPIPKKLLENGEEQKQNNRRPEKFRMKSIIKETA